VHGGKPFSRFATACNQIHCGVPVKYGAERDPWHAPHEQQIVIGEKANRLRHPVMRGSIETGFREGSIDLVTLRAEIVGARVSSVKV